MEFSKGEIIAHLKGKAQAKETILTTWDHLSEEQRAKLKIQLELINELLFKFDDKTKKPGE